MAMKLYRATWTTQDVYSAAFWAEDEDHARELAGEGIPEWAEWKQQPARLEKLEETTEKGGRDAS